MASPDLLPDDLRALAEAWLDFPGRDLDHRRRPPPPAALPAALAATVTAAAPYRARVLADAALWSRLGRPRTSAGAERILLPAPAPAPFERWSISLSPLVLRVEWPRTIPGLEVDYYRFGIHRVVVEDGAWRVLELFDARARQQVLKVIAHLEGLPE